jgi:hypothetical protein
MMARHLWILLVFLASVWVLLWYGLPQYTPLF